MSISTKIKKDIRSWSRDVLEEPSEFLNGFPPCPYAKSAWKQKKVSIEVFNLPEGCEGGLIGCPEIFDDGIKSILEDDRDVHIIAIPNWQELGSAESTDVACMEANKVLAPSDIYLMSFHPEDQPDSENFEFLYKTYDEQPGLDYYAMIFVQRLSLLNAASDALTSKGYYDNWKVKAYNSLMSPRWEARFISEKYSEKECPDD